MSVDIQEPFIRKQVANKAFSAEEQRLRSYLSDGFVLSVSKLLWCILARSRGQIEYEALIVQLRGMLEAYVEKAMVSEHLALMVVGLLGFTEVSHYQQVGAKLLRSRKGTEVMTNDQQIAEVRHYMEDRGRPRYADLSARERANVNRDGTPATGDH